MKVGNCHLGVGPAGRDRTVGSGVAGLIEQDGLAVAADDLQVREGPAFVISRPGAETSQ